MKTKKWRALAALALSIALLGGCGASAGTDGGAEGTDGGTAVTSAATVIDVDTAFTDRDMDASYDASSAVDVALTGESAASAGAGVTVDGSTVTITAAGVYVLHGTLHGMVIVDADKTDKVQLVLSGAEITSDSSAALYVRQADKVFLTLAQGTDNTLANGGAFAAIDESNIDGAVFAKDDLTLNGSGTLTITSPAGHGVVCKDDLVITGGDYTVTAASHGFCGKESLRVAGGTFTVTAGKDGFHAEDKDDDTLGWLYVKDGSFTVTSEGDGLSAAQTLRLDGGDYTLATGDGSASVSHTAADGWVWGGRGSFTMPDGTKPDGATPPDMPDGATIPDMPDGTVPTPPDDTAVSSATPETNGAPAASATDAAEETASAKGVKSGTLLQLNGGSYHMDCADDALHSNGDIALTGGTYTLATGDDGLHADGAASISGGTIAITASYEGIEGGTIDISGGDITLAASDDGLNAAGGADQSGMGGYGGFESGSFADGECAITITGGTLRIDAGGDGVDSNGSLTVTGGEVYVSGPTDSGNGALDYTTTAAISGGVFAAAGSAGMAQNFGDTSTQCAMLVSTGTQAAGTAITLTDSAGKTLMTYTPDKSYECVVLSCPGLAQGGSYTLTAGSFSASVTMDTLLYSDVTGMGAMGGGMGHGGQGGFKDGTAPTRPTGGAQAMPGGKTA